ncbi:hypothetical protein IJ541_03795 [bacterium]|nr:hypothetical protein [bacterium]
MFTYNSFPNIPFVVSNALPGGFMNIAGDTVCYTIPEECLPQTDFGFSLNQNAQARLNNYNINPWGYGLPQFSPEAINAWNQQILAPTADQIASQRINGAKASIASTKAKIQAKLNNKDITDEEKARLEALLEELKAQEEKLQNVIDNSYVLTREEASKQAGEVADAVADINSRIDGEKKDEKVDNKDKTDNKDKVNKDETDDDETDETKKTKETQGKKDVTYSSTIKRDIERFYYATYCVGTDDPEMENVIGNIDSDNVMDYMTAWNKYHSAEKGESFMKAFISDANEGFWGNALSLGVCHLFGYGTVSDQKVNGCRQVALALREKAEELGIYDECAADFAAINKELGSWLWIDNAIYKHYDNIIKKIANKMGPGYAKNAEPKVVKS